MINKCRILLLVAFCLLGAQGMMELQGQTRVSLRNNSWLDLQVSLRFSGTHVPDSAQWSLLATRQVPWQVDQPLLDLQRDSLTVPAGDTSLVELLLVAGADTAALRLELVGDSTGTQLRYAGALPGQIDAWQSDGNFHQVQSNMGGTDFILKYKPDNDDANQDRDVLFVLHQKPEYSLDPADFNDPQVLNVVSYNVQFLPFFIGGFSNGLRADLIPSRMDPGLDVIIIEEAFDDGPRNNGLIAGLQQQGFVYNSGILNDYLPWNGGVIIFSRWPIEVTGEYDFALCGPNSGDCFANKGIMYARVNKLGKRYHVFGTHMDAGSDPDDLEAKNLQFREMETFIAQQNIPAWEPILYGGDFNVSPTSGHDLYPNMLDSLAPLVPYYDGFHNSTMSTDTGHIIDHVWLDRRGLHPLTAQNTIVTLRGLEPDMWEISDYSDHRTCLARYSFPELSHAPFDSSMCPGDNLDLEVQASGASFQYQWYKDGLPIAGETTSSLSLSNLQPGNDGSYACEIRYTNTWGLLTDPVNSLFYPNGPETLTASIWMDGWSIDLNCGVSRPEPLALPGRVYPQPLTGGALQLEFPGKVEASLRDLQGKLLRQASLVGPRVSWDLGDLPAGVYTLRLQGTQGQSVHKVVVTN